MNAKQTETREWVEREGKPGVVYVAPDGVAYIRGESDEVKPEDPADNYLNQHFSVAR